MTFIKFEEDYKNRVVAEYNELYEKREKLGSFLEKFPEKADFLLQLQYDVMGPYLKVLNQRIQAWL